MKGSSLLEGSQVRPASSAAQRARAQPAAPPPLPAALLGTGRPSPETTSASLGPTVWQLPMARAGRRALGPAPTRTAAAGLQRPAAPSLRRHPQHRPLAAPLRGRSPAGSVAPEGGAGRPREAGTSASVAASTLYCLGLRGDGARSLPNRTPRLQISWGITAQRAGQSTKPRVRSPAPALSWL